MDTDPPTYCTMFHHMVKNGGTNIRDQLVLSAEAQRRDPPGMLLLLSSHVRMQTFCPPPVCRLGDDTVKINSLLR